MYGPVDATPQPAARRPTRHRHEPAHRLPRAPEPARALTPQQQPSARQTLGSHADLYGSADSADDLAAVVTALGLSKIDLYGDSYGTFFAQTFAGRHPTMLRSLVLDGAYPTTGEDAWYPTQGPAMLRSINLVCARTPACSALGTSTGSLLQQVLAKVRKCVLGMGSRRTRTVSVITSRLTVPRW